jgi:hypothetical protein
MARVAFVALWLGLSIAARPNLAPLVIVTAVALWRHAPREQRLRQLALWLVPLGVIAVAMTTYNFVRFRQPFEFGVRYQLGADLIGDRICGLASGGEVVRFANMVGHHVFQPPTFGGDFPWVNLPWSRVDPRVTPGSEQSGGIGAVTPITLIATVLLVTGFGRNRGAGGAAAIYVMAAAWVILLSVSTCWFVASRYSLDYALLMTSAAIVSLESLMAAEERPHLKLVSLALLVYSIVVGTLLGFAGPYDAFKTQNAPLLERITAALPGTPPRPTLHETVRLRGWAVHVNGPIDITVVNPDGSPAEGARVRRLPSPDIYEHFASRWKPFPPLRHARFEIDAPSLDAELALSFQGHEVQRIRLRDYPGITLHPDVRLAIDEFVVTPQFR